MRLRLIRRGVWTLYAVSSPSGCQLAEFLGGFRDRSDSLAKNKLQMLERLERIAESGPPRNTEISHQIASDIWQIEKGRIRALYFYGEERRTLIFSHGFVKDTQKTRKADVERALASLGLYRAAIASGDIEHEEG